MLCFADDNLIAGFQTRAHVALRHHINGFGGAARPDDILAGRGVEQRRHPFARVFIAFG